MASVTRSEADLIAGVLWLGITIYAVLGGADFGAGMWDLLAGDGVGEGHPVTQDDRNRTAACESSSLPAVSGPQI